MVVGWQVACQIPTIAVTRDCLGAVKSATATDECACSEERDSLVIQLKSLGDAMFSSHNDHIAAVLRRDLNAVRELRHVLLQKLQEHLVEHDC